MTPPARPLIVRDLAPYGALGGAAAAVGTIVVAAVARAADVGLEVEGEAIPLPAFAFWSLVGAAIGVLLARILGQRRRFVVVTVVGTALSLVPAVVLPDDTATSVVLVATHVLAAAIIVPVVARAL